jgi:hypothetical protein
MKGADILDLQCEAPLHQLWRNLQLSSQTLQGPPYPVSASAMRGMEVSRFAIISALAVMSFGVAIPRSAQPSRGIEVPDPVCVASS